MKIPIRVLREMAQGDDVVSSVLEAVRLRVLAHEGLVPRDSCEFVRSCMEDMEHSWEDFITLALNFLVYGWSWFEIVYKKRPDGKIGWKKLAYRPPESLAEWKYDDDGEFLGMEQWIHLRNGGAAANAGTGTVFIPKEKAVHFRTAGHGGQPEGRSLLTGAFRTWQRKQRVLEIEEIGVQRDLAGYPYIRPPAGVELYDDEGAPTPQMSRAMELVRRIRRDECEGLVLPHGWEFALVGSGGSRQFDTNTIINRYDSRIAMTMMADFVMLGHENSGSHALCADKTEMFEACVSGIAGIMRGVIEHQIVRRLLEVNENLK